MRIPAYLLIAGCLIAGGCFTACGGPPSAVAPHAETDAPAKDSSESASEADAADSEKAAGASAAGALPLPTECAGSTDPCTPSAKFVKALCQDVYPDVALHLFHKGTPWRRAYLTRKTKAWNASGGASASDEMLEFDEEVLVLLERKSNMGGMQVSGAGSGFDAIRWDGSCVTLSGEELTTNHPPKAKTAKVEWRRLGTAMQEALRTNDVITEAYRTRRGECKGAASGDVSLKCVKADERLSESIIEHVRNGGALGEPQQRP